MRKSTYVKASSAHASYFSAQEKRNRKIVDIIFAVIALIAIGFAIFMYIRFSSIKSAKKDAEARLENARISTEAYDKQRKALKIEIDELQTSLDKLRIEYDSLSE